MEKLRIGDILVLDTQTRILSCPNKPHKVTLGVSACLCLEELIKAEGATLSQESLIDKGWRQVGIEVTASSLRGVINQLRKAFLSLRIDKEVLIVTVPRLGYRMLTSAENIIQPDAETSDPVSLPESISETTKGSIPKQFSSGLLPTQFYRTSVLKWLAFILSSVLLSALLAWGVSFHYWRHIVSINYIPYTGAGTKMAFGNAQVYVDPDKTPDAARVKETLILWKKYYPETEKWNYLYVSDGTASYLYSMFGCTKPLGELENDCLSFVFKTP
ncbi:winged helix-turn-helix domain-containing protein [Ewingella americana]|uniref:winged helix-turn-helix domain-containing protein n=1 Tax=Ewingella americana TaxID=41202 RepID=UPI0012AE8E21|nr:winged helix-turn-helix domain-containing protein [Ewingella americana]MRT06079.1 hypothetical protein [Ewingella americana]